MPVKRRRSKHSEYRITPAAVAAFRANDSSALALALNLRPWEDCPLDVDDGPAPAYEKTDEFWRKAQELRRALIAATQQPERGRKRSD